MSTEVIVDTQYDTILVEGSEQTILVESETTTTIITPAEQGPQGPPGLSASQQPISTAPDMDVTNIQEGSLPIWSVQSQKWVASTQLTNQSLESGQY